MARWEAWRKTRKAVVREAAGYDVVIVKLWWAKANCRAWHDRYVLRAAIANAGDDLQAIKKAMELADLVVV